MIKHLEPWEEISGTLRSAEEDGKGNIILDFEQRCKVTIHTTANQRKRLKNMVGKKIGILQTDMENKPYVVREITETHEKELGIIQKDENDRTSQ